MFNSQAEMLRQLEASQPAEMQEFSGRVVGVTDGDTITVLHDGVGEKIRLAGIDCPERGQDYGTRAKQFLSALVFRKTVRVYDQGQDRYGRTIGTVLLPDDTKSITYSLNRGCAGGIGSMRQRTRSWRNTNVMHGKPSGGCGLNPIRFHPGNGEQRGSGIARQP